MKKIVPILLVICTFLSVFSIFTIPAHALAEGAAIVLMGLASFCIGECISNIGSQAGGALAQTISDFERDHQAFLNSTNSIIYDTSTGSFSINGDYDYSSDIEYEIALDVVNELNKNAMNKIDYIVQSSRYTGFFDVEPAVYSEIKSTIADRVAKRLYAESQNKTMADLSEAADVPLYSFDFVGPIQPEFNIPGVYGPKALSRDGFSFSIPIAYPGKASLPVSSANSILSSFPGASILELGNNTCRIQFGNGCYGFCTYILYGGKIYYNRPQSYYKSTAFTSYASSFPSTRVPPSYFVCEDGTTLADVGLTSIDGLSMGVAVNTTGELASGVPTVFPDETQFSEYTEGSSISVPRTDDENNIGLGIGLGLIGDSDLIELNPDGTIKSVGGIDMAKLTELVGKLKTGSLDFENVQEYLELIAQLVGNSNLTAQEQSKLLANVQANVASLADIKIKSDYKFDVKTPDTIINKFPFSLPFDVYNVFNLLSAPPQTPKFTIPFEMNGVFKEEITIDLSLFDNIAYIVRWLLYILFILGLILVTNKLIGRG